MKPGTSGNITGTFSWSIKSRDETIGHLWPIYLENEMYPCGEFESLLSFNAYVYFSFLQLCPYFTASTSVFMFFFCCASVTFTVMNHHSLKFSEMGKDIYAAPELNQLCTCPLLNSTGFIESNSQRQAFGSPLDDSLGGYAFYICHKHDRFIIFILHRYAWFVIWCG